MPQSEAVAVVVSLRGITQPSSVAVVLNEPLELAHMPGDLQCTRRVDRFKVLRPFAADACRPWRCLAREAVQSV